MRIQRKNIKRKEKEKEENTMECNGHPEKVPIMKSKQERIHKWEFKRLTVISKTQTNKTYSSLIYKSSTK